MASELLLQELGVPQGRCCGRLGRAASSLVGARITIEKEELKAKLHPAAYESLGATFPPIHVLPFGQFFFEAETLSA